MNGIHPAPDLDSLKQSLDAAVARARHCITDPRLLAEKWLRPQPQLFELYLHDLRELSPAPGSSVLDLGCGPGFLLWMCRAVEDCEITGLEGKWRDDLSSIWRELGIQDRIVQQRIIAFTPLAVDRQYDTISAIRICFDKTANIQWTLPEYVYFLFDVSKHLTPTGTLYLRFNPSRDPGEAVHRALNEMGMHQNQLAFRLRNSESKVTDFVRRRYPDLAVR